MDKSKKSGAGRPPIGPMINIRVPLHIAVWLRAKGKGRMADFVRALIEREYNAEHLPKPLDD